MTVALNIQDSTLAIAGPLTFQTIETTLTPAQTIIQQHPIEAIDCRAIEHCDSAGLALLIHLWRTAQNQTRTVHFLHLPEQIRTLADSCGLLNLLEGYPHG